MLKKDKTINVFVFADAGLFAKFRLGADTKRTHARIQKMTAADFDKLYIARKL